jgi:hypothetical protein
MMASTPASAQTYEEFMEAAILEAEHAVDAGNHPFGM